MFLHPIFQTKLRHTKDRMYFFKQWNIMITKQTRNITKLFPQPQLSQQADIGLHEDAVLHRVWAEAGPLGRHRVSGHAEHLLAFRAGHWHGEGDPDEQGEEGHGLLVPPPPVQLVHIHKKIGQSGGASRWRVCYQRGLPRLVLRPQHFLGEV